MDIPEIIKLESNIEMRREVIKLAIERGLCEEEIWQEFNIYRKQREIKDINNARRARSIREIVPQVLAKYNITITDSPIEDTFMYELKNRNIKFESQKQIGKYRVDFYIPQANLVVEIDGKDYHSSREQRINDEKRQSAIERKGYLFVRFTGREVYQNTMECVDSIEVLLLT